MQTDSKMGEALEWGYIRAIYDAVCFRVTQYVMLVLLSSETQDF